MLPHRHSSGSGEAVMRVMLLAVLPTLLGLTLTMGLGRFLDWSFFQQHGDRRVGGLLISRIAGVRTSGKGGAEYLVSERSGRRCYPQTIVNGVLYEGPDLSSINAADIIGFEYYTPTNTPLRYNSTGNGATGAQCGTAIFWMK